MTDADELLASTIDEYLLSIAEGISAAQTELDRYGLGPNASHRYHLPKVDFELKITLELREVARQIAGHRAQRSLFLRPVAALDAQSSGFSAEAVSTISGSFVAIPKEGSGFSLETEVEAVEPRVVRFTVRATTAAGQPLGGLEIHFNLDRALSRTASAKLGMDVALDPKTTFLDGISVTDERGSASSLLEIDDGIPPGYIIVVALDAGTRTELLHYRYGGS